MKKWKRGISLCMAAAMTILACACGSVDGIRGGDQEADSSLAKQYVFRNEPIDLSIDFENADIYGMSYVNDKIYALIYRYTWKYYDDMPVVDDLVDEIDEIDDEGTDVEDVEAGETEEGIDISASVFIEDQAVPATASSSMEMTVDVPVAEPEDYSSEEDEITSGFICVSMRLDGSDRQEAFLSETGGSENSSFWLNTTVVGNDGRIYATAEVYRNDYSDPENPIYENATYLYCWESDGTVAWKQNMSETIAEDEWFYASGMDLDQDGNLIMLVQDKEYRVYDGEGNLVQNKALDMNGISNPGSTMINKDGTLYITSYDDDWTAMYISVYDPATGNVGELKSLPDSIYNFSISKGVGTDLLLTSSTGIYTYNIGDPEPVKIMDYINSDLPSSGYLNYLTWIDDEHFVASYYDLVDYERVVAQFSYVSPESIPDKKVLVLGCSYVGSDIKRRIINFNKTSTEYRITVKDYSVYSSMDDYMARYTQLNNDIISGQMPDILVTDSNMNVNNYINKGLLADIGALIDADEELSREDFLENVFDAFSVNGKLYTVVSSFIVQTMIGKKALLGDRTGWNMQEFSEVMSQMPEGMTAFDADMLRSSFMYTMMNYSGSDFVDPDTGKCNFDSEDFKAMLEYAKTLPKDYPEDYWENYNWESYQTMYRDGRCLLGGTSIYSITDLVYTIKGQFGGDVAFVGFPCEGRNGSVINAYGNTFALSAKSANLQGAWEFVRYYLTDEYQSGDESWGLPVSRKAFDEKAELATHRPYWIDADGNKQEYDATYYINGEEIILEPFTQEEVDAIKEFIYTVKRQSYYNSDIIDIITEEAEGFFTGQKSVDEVTQIIQSRIQLYVDENR